MELWLIADTNLFFECKPLNQLPWEKMSHDPIVVLLTKPVLDEIDKHKKGSGRTRDRALEIFGHVRTMLIAKTTEIELSPSSPRVVLRLDNTRPDPALKDDLDYGKVDEKLVGIVASLVSKMPDYVVELFTDDTGPASTAHGLGLPFRMIDRSWRRPPSESTDIKKIKELEKDLATYRAQEPQISIGSCENANASNIVAVKGRIANALTQDEVEDLILSLIIKHPLRTEFVPPPASSLTKANGEIVRTEYAAPSGEALAKYRDAHLRWIDECRGILAKLHEGRDEEAPPLIIRWPMSNVGTRPASHVRIEFQATGAVRLKRLPPESDKDDDVVGSADPTAQARSAPTPRFPSPPQAPAFQANVTRTSPPVRPKPMSQTAGVATTAADFLGRHDNVFARSISDIKRAGLLSDAQRLGLSASAAEAAGLLARRSLFDPPYGAISSITAMPVPLPRISAPFHQRPHEQEAFYWDWTAHRAVETGALTCDLWRHKVGTEIFEFEVLFCHEGEIRGSVECTVHAENLTKPEQARVIVCRTMEQFTVKNIAQEMIEACN